MWEVNLEVNMEVNLRSISGNLRKPQRNLRETSGNLRKPQRNLIELVITQSNGRVNPVKRI